MSKGTHMKADDNLDDVQLRIMITPEVRFGPGKANLLEGIKDTGSIAAAGRRIGMSYKRAWYLVNAMNSHFNLPLVESTKGGTAGGGASLTPLGEELLSVYRTMQRLTEKAVLPELRRLRRKASRRSAI
ncbi:winged helix-turn-helix domain-containing protein [Hyphomicrobium zavarzinii]|uniref:winged helix-turn-helix domain-containing protein n=1 Tax=Hyphomicrobium zavarzinii TaxID=48292 RepID=UPI001FDA2DF6|nr:LysR family transcriptional regulator [Hyphomicrobium zavarzinii]